MRSRKNHFPLKIDFKIKCNLEKEIKIFFEFYKKVANITPPEEKIIFNKALFIQYEQFKLNKSLIQYIEVIMISTKILRMGIQKAPLQKAYGMVVGSQSFNVDFLGSHRQFDGLEILLVFDKSDKDTIIYNSYSVERQPNL